MFSKKAFSEKLCRNDRMEMGSLFSVKWKIVDLLIGTFYMREGAEFLFKIIYEIKNTISFEYLCVNTQKYFLKTSVPELIMQSVSIKLLEMPRIKCTVVNNIRKIWKNFSTSYSRMLNKKVLISQLCLSKY